MNNSTQNYKTESRIARLNIKSVKVSNMTSPRSYSPVANQYIITTYTHDGDLVEYFQSYETVIAMKIYGSDPVTILDENSWDYSRTTSKYRNEFLKENTAETKKKIKDGVYQLANLN